MWWFPRWETVQGIVERIITAAVMWFVARGLLAEGQAAEVVAALVVLASAAYGAWVNRPKALLTAVANIESVGKVDMKPTTAGEALAASVPSPKVAVDNRFSPGFPPEPKGGTA